MRVKPLLGLALLAGGLLASGPSVQTTARPAGQTAAGADPIPALHERALVWDCHNDLAHRVRYEKLDIGNRLPGGQVDIPRLREGRVDVQVVALYIANYLYPDKAAAQAFDLIESMRAAFAAHPDKIELARTGSDIERIAAAGRIAMPLSIEGGHAIQDSLDLLRRFRELGVSAMTLTHNVSHGWADSGGDKVRWNGLNDLGREVVAEMNRIGMVVDVSHVSDKAFFDVLETSRHPVILSHSGVRAVNPHRRNVSDDMLRALARNGGVIGIVFEVGFLSASYSKARDELRAIARPFFRQAPVPEDLELRITLDHINESRDWPLEGLPSIEDLLDHIDHAVKVAGVDHVGLGADMYPRTPSPIGIRGAQDYPAITRGLKGRGYSDEDVLKIMGGNFLRVWKRVAG